MDIKRRKTIILGHETVFTCGFKVIAQLTDCQLGMVHIFILCTESLLQSFAKPKQLMQ